jgi:hypothetical protein
LLGGPSLGLIKLTKKAVSDGMDVVVMMLDFVKEVRELILRKNALMFLLPQIKHTGCGPFFLPGIVHYRQILSNGLPLLDYSICYQSGQGL